MSGAWKEALKAGIHCVKGALHTQPPHAGSGLCMRRVVDDFRFALLRHWTLYDAMRHSTYVAVRLQTWTDSGQRRLQELLARMGFLLSDCCQDYGEAQLHTLYRAVTADTRLLSQIQLRPGSACYADCPRCHRLASSVPARLLSGNCRTMLELCMALCSLATASLHCQPRMPKLGPLRRSMWPLIGRRLAQTLAVTACRT